MCVIGDRQALAWVLREQQMAFPAHRARLAASIHPGDTIFLYTTRGCFNSPTKDRGRVIGEAKAMSQVAALESPVTFGDRSFPIGCSLQILTAAPARQGVELGPLVGRLSAFRETEHWSVYLRTALVPLNQADAALLRRHLRNVTGTVGDVLPGYEKAAQRRDSRRLLPLD